MNSAQALVAANASSTEAARPKDIPSSYGGTRGGTGHVCILQTRCLGEDGREHTDFEFGSGMILESIVDIRAPVQNAVFRYALDSVHYKHFVVLDSLEQGASFPYLEPGRHHLRVHLPTQNLRPGLYTVNASICQRGIGIHLYFEYAVSRFRVLNPPSRLLYAGDQAIVHLESSFAIHSESDLAMRVAG
jgi:hypothetical protein